MARPAPRHGQGTGRLPGWAWPGPAAVIAIAQLFGTSLWFSANSAADGLMRSWGADAADIAWLTTAVQGGFIAGTLGLSFTGIADRYRPSRIFVISASAGAALNLGFAYGASGVGDGAVYRFLVGVSLAGIYPIGMKLVVGWDPQRTGRALALLVAMLTLGTALPHLLRAMGGAAPWQHIIAASSALAVLGAVMIGRLGDGPHATQAAPRSRRTSPLSAFRIRRFRAAACGYFGHMWELYAFWAALPFLAGATGLAARYPALGTSGIAFAVIAAGAAGCLMGGRLSPVVGSEKVALGALALSGSCALIFVLAWQSLPPVLLLLLLLVWGAAVVADSPQFSALSAGACPREVLGGALAVQNAIGFAITMLSIPAAAALLERSGPSALWLLLPGPALGLISFIAITRRSKGRENAAGPPQR
ncbi:MFS transporter [Pseudoroseomonas globiformis]|uniref:MFS transporter n=1 Tax=Teichococcus globiformis TaxID=2307229 RepID=A0ABV7G6Z2_9PROT